MFYKKKCRTCGKEFSGPWMIDMCKECKHGSKKEEEQAKDEQSE